MLERLRKAQHRQAQPERGQSEKGVRSERGKSNVAPSANQRVYRMISNGVVGGRGILARGTAARGSVSYKAASKN